MNKSFELDSNKEVKMMNAMQVITNAIDNSVKEVYAIINGIKFTKKSETELDAKIFVLFSLPESIVEKLCKLEGTKLKVNSIQNSVEFTTDENLVIGLTL